MQYRIFLAALLGLAFAIGSLSCLGSGHDDIFIHLRAAASFGPIESFPFYWWHNANGQVQEVSSSPLLLLIGAPLLKLAPFAWQWLAWKLFFFSLYAVFVACLAHLLLARGRLLAVAFVVVLLAIPAIPYWAFSGMENGLLSIGLFLLAVFLVQATLGRAGAHMLAAGALVVFAFLLIRPDNLWAVPPALLVLALPGVSRSARAGFALGCLFYFGFLCLRQSATGEWSANPTIAKTQLDLVSLQRGALYLYGFFTQSVGYVFLLAAIIAASLRAGLHFIKRQPHDFLQRLASIILLLWWAHSGAVLLIGGDWMSHYRFAVKGFDLALLATVLVFARELLALRACARVRQLCAGLAAVALVLFLQSVTGGVTYPMRPEITAMNKIDGVSLQKRFYAPTLLPVDIPSLLRSRDPLMAYQWNVTTRRDSIQLEPFLRSPLLREATEQANALGRPIIFASYQGGYFVWRLRQLYSPAEVAFLDLAGLDTLAAAKLAVPKEPLGLSHGVWRYDEASNAAPQTTWGRFMQSCPPDFIYVLGLTGAEKLTSYRLVYRQSLAVVLARDIAAHTPAQRQACRQMGLY